MASETALNEYSNRIEAVLQRGRAPASVVGGKILPGFVEFLLRPYPGTRVNQITSLRDDISLAIGCRNIRIAQSGTHMVIQVARLVSERKPIALDRLIARSANRPPYAAVLGVPEDGGVLLARLPSPDVAHALISGTTGSGKTMLAYNILLSLAAQHPPRQLGIIILDPKRRDNDPFVLAMARHMLLPVARDPDQVVSALTKVVNVMERRSCDVDPTPRIVVYADEVADLCMTGGNQVVDLLTRIAQRGREPGIHLVACTQKPTSKALHPLFKANLPLRLAGHVLSIEDARVATGIPGSGAEHLRGRGDFIAVFSGRALRFQAALPNLADPGVRIHAQPRQDAPALPGWNEPDSPPASDRATDDLVNTIAEIITRDPGISLNQISMRATGKPYAGSSHVARIKAAYAAARQITTTTPENQPEDASGATLLLGSQ